MYHPPLSRLVALDSPLKNHLENMLCNTFTNID
ncbi:hypothetical protein A1YK_04540 [Escherichia coli KTE134]|nr:hypothetical protein A15Q_02244 [Escherichia coli KTE208]EOW50944.1 hypothetical protein A1YK_04540 [Escherichia coli KTE134]